MSVFVKNIQDGVCLRDGTHEQTGFSIHLTIHIVYCELFTAFKSANI